MNCYKLPENIPGKKYDEWDVPNTFLEANSNILIWIFYNLVLINYILVK